MYGCIDGCMDVLKILILKIIFFKIDCLIQGYGWIEG